MTPVQAPRILGVEQDNRAAVNLYVSNATRRQGEAPIIKFDRYTTADDVL